ncbi:hypothetical protein DSO57_1018824 [Entomophthora muscae]|uniref:Uncharacterized protein n=1 Tax=Entomophthora muscae TaxID=34485 RepID=A0ACC2TF89_9FUNG|nr:hypothetical protein DSO57_1018824 [Entomophthora muscae]
MTTLPSIDLLVPEINFKPTPRLISSIRQRSSEDTRQLSKLKPNFQTRAKLPSNPRHRMAPRQTSTLELVFRMCPFPTRGNKEFLASLLNTSPRRIQVWFQNKRQKIRTGLISKPN